MTVITGCRLSQDQEGREPGALRGGCAARHKGSRLPPRLQGVANAAALRRSGESRKPFTQALRK